MQMLHQMYTTSTRYGVFMSATESCVCSTVIVKLPVWIEAIVASEMSKLSGIVSWSHTGTVDEAVDSIPDTIAESDMEAVKSHLSFWHLVNAHVLANGPFPPLKLVKNAVQSFYSKTKPGVDGLTQDREVLANASAGMKWEQMVATKGLQTCAHNAHVAYKLHQRRDLVEDRDLFGDLSTFRTRIAHVEGFSTFCFKGAIELLSSADSLAKEDAQPTPDQMPATTEHNTLRRVKRHRIRHWNLDSNKAMRYVHDLGHVSCIYLTRSLLLLLTSIDSTCQRNTCRKPAEAPRIVGVLCVVAQGLCEAIAREQRARSAMCTCVSAYMGISGEHVSKFGIRLMFWSSGTQLHRARHLVPLPMCLLPWLRRILTRSQTPLHAVLLVLEQIKHTSPSLVIPYNR